MTRIRVALDANIPQRAVRMLQSGFGDQGFEFLWEPDFETASADDEIWIESFRRFGGHVIISGDPNIGKRPHQIVAVKSNNIVSFFIQKQWSRKDLVFKAAHLIHWWPRIQDQYFKSSPRDAWWVPATLGAKSGFKKIELPKDVEEAARRSSSG